MNKEIRLSNVGLGKRIKVDVTWAYLNLCPNKIGHIELN